MKKMLLAVLLAMLLACALSLSATAEIATWLWPMDVDFQCTWAYDGIIHKGVDTGGCANQPIKAPMDATVVFVATGCTNHGGYNSSHYDPCRNRRDRGLCTGAKVWIQGSGTQYGQLCKEGFCNYGFGNGVTLLSDDGLLFQVPHMNGGQECQNILNDFMARCERGEQVRVKAGQIIGYCGGAGLATGYHMHLEVRGYDSSRSMLNQIFNGKLYDPTPGHGYINWVRTPSFYWDEYSIDNVQSRYAHFKYRCRTGAVSVAKITEMGFVITSGHKVTQVWKDPILPQGPTFWDDLDTRKMNITLIPNETYTCYFYADYEGKRYQTQAGTFRTPGEAGTGKFLTITDEKSAIRNDYYETGKKIGSASPGEVLRILGQAVNSKGNTWYKVQSLYDQNMVGWIYAEHGKAYSPSTKTVTSINKKWQGVPIRQSFYGSAKPIEASPNFLAPGSTVTVLGQYVNSYNNRWYFIVDSSNHYGWVWSEYLGKPSSSVSVAAELIRNGVNCVCIDCPESGENDASSRRAATYVSGKGSTSGGYYGGGGYYKPVLSNVSFTFSEPVTFETDACLDAFAYPSPSASFNWTRNIIHIWNAETGEELKLNANADESTNWHSNRLRIYFMPISGELGVHLEPGTTYNYQLEVWCEGKKFTSPMQQFKTKGHRNCTVTLDTDGGTPINPIKVRYDTTMPELDLMKYETQHGVVINYVFRGWYRDAERTIPFTDTSRVKEDMTLYAKWEPEKPIVSVTGIVLDKSSGTIYSNSDEDMLTLNATLTPAEATFTDVIWRTSDPEIANIDQYGHIVAIGPGTATITCESIEKPEVKATCQVIVKQRMNWLFLREDDFSIYSQDEMYLNCGFLPQNATETSVNWTSSNPSVATVDGKGTVTGIAPGESIITVTAADGSALSASCKVTVEKNLSLVLSEGETTLIRGGAEENTVAYVFPSTGSIGRNEDGQWQWNVTTSGNAASVNWDLADLSFTEQDGTLLQARGLRVYTTALNSAGRTSVNVSCNTGTDTETLSFDINVSELAQTLPSQLTLAETIFDLTVNQPSAISLTPVAVGGGTVPEGLDLKLAGNSAFMRHAALEETQDGWSITFDEPGRYAVDAEYRLNNLYYAVPLVFNVADENNIVHLPVSQVLFSMDDISMIEGDTLQMEVTVEPADAWDKTLKWHSSNSASVTVDEQGVITAVTPGSAVITAEAADGSDAVASVTVVVENHLQLETNVIDVNVYTGGDSNAALCDISLTQASMGRIMAAGSELHWELKPAFDEEHLVSMALETEPGCAVLRLLRVHGAGSEDYWVTCRTGDYRADCLIRLHVLDAALPQSVTVADTTINGSAGNALTLDATPICQPALPDGTRIELTGSAALMANLRDLTYDGVNITFTIDRPAAYQAALRYTGANYSFETPIRLVISDSDGAAPVMADSISLDRDALLLYAGDSVKLTATVLPSTASDASVTWHSADEETAQVAQDGTVTAVSAGHTIISAVNVTSGLVANCPVVVEDGLSIDSADVSMNIFLEGQARTSLTEIFLTEASSLRLEQPPQWSLKRVSGNNLTLRTTPVTAENRHGATLYGAQIDLYSMSGIGETVYELSCDSGAERDSIYINVFCKKGADDLPTGISAETSVYSGVPGELIQVSPQLHCMPEGTSLPDGARVSWKYGNAFAAALNPEDFHTDRAVSTFSFSEPGCYRADMQLTTANVRYVIPFTFRIADAQGSVPVHGEQLRLNQAVLDLEEGDTACLSPVFTPEDITNRTVTWQSSDPTVASVDASGLVTALKRGTVTITCTPGDSHLNPATCTVRIEDYLMVEDTVDSYSWYLQGSAENAAGSMLLTGGTLERLARDGLTPDWQLTRTSGAHADIEMVPMGDGAGVTLLTNALNAAGEDTYKLTCTAGDHSISRTFTLTIQDLSGNVPTDVALSASRVTTQTGVPVTIDFTPVCTPVGSSIPAGARRYYVGFGDYYKALDRTASSVNDNSDTVTVAFTAPGNYLLCRYYSIRNVRYTTACTIVVGEPEGESVGLLTATETDCAVYAGGRSGIVSTISISDSAAMTLWGDDIKWHLEALSGNGVTARLEPNGDHADLFVADAATPGTSVWRVSCQLGTITESIDITIRAIDPFYALPESLTLVTDRLNGMTGETMILPMGVQCSPSGSRLPESGDSFWRFESDAKAAKEGSWQIEGGVLKLVFTRSGYYTGHLIYENGNVRYSLPVYITVRDEEDQTPEPDLDLVLLDVSPVVYPEGETGVSLGVAVVNEGLSAYNTGSAPSYMMEYPAEWTVEVDSNALELSLAPSAVNARSLVLDRVSGTGDVGYTVTCTVGGRTLTAQGTLHIAASGEARPTPELKQSEYTVVTGKKLSIDRRLYARNSDSLLQASTQWNADELLSAIGYQYGTSATQWTVKFYKVGVYQSSVDGYVGNLHVEVPLTINVYYDADDVAGLPVVCPPASLKRIEEEAFADSRVQAVDLRGTGVTRIDSAAFRNCAALKLVYFPNSSVTIADDAFADCFGVCFVCNENSDAAAYARAHGIAIQQF